MNKTILTILFCLMAFCSWGQEYNNIYFSPKLTMEPVGTFGTASHQVSAHDYTAAASSNYPKAAAGQPSNQEVKEDDDSYQVEDSLRSMDTDRYSPAPYYYDQSYYSPYYGYGAWSPYSLHEGLNVGVDMSVSAEFGKGARSGVGFDQILSATYIHPLSNHLWFSAGGYIDHLTWGGDHYLSAGIRGELGYQFDEHWAAYIYGQKNLVNRGGYYYSRFGGTGYGRNAFGGPGFGRFGYNRMYSPYAYENLSDKLGVGVRWAPSPNFSLQIQVEKNWWNY